MKTRQSRYQRYRFPPGIIQGATISGGAWDGAEFVLARAALTTREELPFVSDEGHRSMAAGDVRLADGRGQFSLRKIRPQCFNVTIPVTGLISPFTPFELTTV